MIIQGPLEHLHEIVHRTQDRWAVGATEVQRLHLLDFPVDQLGRDTKSGEDLRKISRETRHQVVEVSRCRDHRQERPLTDQDYEMTSGRIDDVGEPISQAVLWRRWLSRVFNPEPFQQFRGAS